MASLVDYLKGQGKPSDLSSRAQLAVDSGLVKTTQDYFSRAAAGTNGDINTSLLTKLQTPAVPGQTPNPTVNAPINFNQQAPVVSNNPLTSTQLETSATSPNPTSFVQANTGATFGDMVSNVAKMNITDANKQSIDTLRAQLQEQQTKEKEAAQAKLDGTSQQISDVVGQKSAENALNTAFETYKVKENLNLYNEIQGRVVEAQKALEMGMIYEGDRPVRQQLLLGRTASLQKQGLATIGALQGTAAVIKGNIDLARSFAEATVSAINSDNERSFKALTTLLDLESNSLVALTKAEKDTINERLGMIEDEADRLQKNKDDVVEYMTKYPSAFSKGGVTLLDSKESALQKMLPYLQEVEQAQLKADLEYKKSQTAVNYANAAKDNAGTKADTPEMIQYKEEVAQLKSKNTPYSDVVAAYAPYGLLSYVNNVYGVKDQLTPDEQIQQGFYNQYINPDGTPKTGYKFSGKLDAKGKPVIEKETAASTGGFWNGIKNIFNPNN